MRRFGAEGACIRGAAEARIPGEAEEAGTTGREGAEEAATTRRKSTEAVIEGGGTPAGEDGADSTSQTLTSTGTMVLQARSLMINHLRISMPVTAAATKSTTPTPTGAEAASTATVPPATSAVNRTTAATNRAVATQRTSSTRKGASHTMPIGSNRRVKRNRT